MLRRFADAFAQDVKHAARTLRQRPGWTAHAVLTLALGIGTATAVFTVAQAVLLRPLPVATPERLVAVSVEQPARDRAREALSPARYLDVRDRIRAFDRVAALRLLTATASTGGSGEHVQLAWITASWFEIQGIAPEAGRSFVGADEAENAPPVALVSRALWRRQFGGVGAVGRTLAIDGQPYTVVGVMPDVLPFPANVDVWTPMAFGVWNRVSSVMHVVGRLAPGATLGTARSALAALDRQLAKEHPESDKRWRTVAVPLAEQITGRARAPLYLLLGSALLLLLIACVNGANLLLALGVESARDLAVRAALGAGQHRLAMHLLARSFLVAVAGGALGVTLAIATTSTALPLIAPLLPRAAEVTIDWRVIAFAISTVLLSTVLAGAVPMLTAIRADLRSVLGDGRGATSSAARRRWRDGLVVTEVALAFALVAAAGLMVNSLVRLSRVDVGFQAESIVTGRLSLPIPMARYRRASERVRFWDALEQKVAAIPGVTSSGLVSSLPFSGTDIRFRFVADDRAHLPPAEAVTEAEYRAVSVGYFDTLGMRLVAGRAFTSRDGKDGATAAIVNQAMARHLWPAATGGDSVRAALVRGLSISGPAGPFIPIVGVVADVRHFGYDRPPAPEVYVPYTQESWPQMTIVARGSAAPSAIASGLRSAVRELDRELGLYKVEPFADIIGETTALRRLVTGVLTAFSCAALLLAAIGISGLLAFAVTVRRREIGIRLALGASSSEVVRMVATHGLKLAGLGIAVGLLASPWTEALLASQLFGIEPSDPPTLATTAAALLLVALAASALPARRASRVDPNSVLRFE